MLIISWLINTVALLATAYIVPGIVIRNIYIALIVALFLGLINSVIRPLLIILTLPLTILSLGFFTLVINGILFWFVASFIEGFSVAGFGAAFFGALMMSVISSLVNWLAKKAVD